MDKVDGAVVVTGSGLVEVESLVLVASVDLEVSRWLQSLQRYLEEPPGADDGTLREADLHILNSLRDGLRRERVSNLL